MQSSIKFLTNQRPVSAAASGTEADAATAVDVASFNRGIIQINIPPFTDSSSSLSSTPPPRQKIRVIMYGSIDCSGSMDESATRCQSHHQQHQQQRTTKMDFVHATLKNMVDTIISQQEEFSHVEFYLALVQFHSSATCVLYPMRVTPDSKDEILRVISCIRPQGGTNFEKCFRVSSHLISTESQHISPSDDIPEHCVQRMHVFLTDGDNNEGNKSIPHLAGLLGESAAAAQPTQIMIGYGTEHDSATLQSLCSHFPNSRQWFIDDIEKTGCIFGEILWSSVNAAFTKVSISTPHAEVYDFETMQWKNEICLGDFAYDSSRTYYIRTPWQHDDLACKLTYTSIEAPQDTSCDVVVPMNYTETPETPETKDAEVEKELWRLDTITTIDKSIQFFKMMRRMTFQDQADTKTRLVAEITAFQEKFLKYATENNLIEDPYIIQLADDLFVCISGLAASYIGERYITARQASQIQQRAVTINDITPIQREIIDSMPIADDEVPAEVASISRMRGRVASFTPDNMASMMMMPPLDDNIPSDYCTPVSRARSAYVGCVANDTTQAPLAAAPTSTPDDQEPNTPNAAAAAAALADDNVLSETQERMLSDLTPSSRGFGSNLRIMTRDAMIGMRKSKVRGRVQYNCGDENDMINGGGCGAYAYDNDFTDSCGGDDTFSSHASPGCARIGRMLSAPAIPPNNLVARTTTSPF
jgi:hypothetical protein